MFNNEYIAKADWNSMCKACKVHRVCRTWVGREVRRFSTSSWGEVPWQTFQTQSQSVLFLSLEVEIAVVALITKLTYDHSTQSVINVQDTDIMLDFSAWKRGSSSSVWQCSSRDHEAIDVDRKCRSLFISLERLIASSYCFLRSYDWPLAGSPIFNWLRDLNSVPDSSDAQTSTNSKALCVLLKGVSGRAKRLQKFMVIAWQQVNITTKNCRWSNNFTTAPIGAE